jgi:hypothetical protein
MITSETLQDRIQHIKGSPYEVGFAIGRHLGERLEHNIARYIREFGDASAKFSIDLVKLHEGALPWLGGLPTRFQQEFAGIAEGAGIPLQRVAEWFFIEQCAVLRCSSVVAVLDGHAWVARNNDTVAPGMWGYVSIREIEGRIPVISFGCEGDVFAPTGINKDRLWLHYHYLPVGDEPAPGRPHLPPFVFMMEALETCRTIQEVENLLHEIQRSDGMMLFAVDGKTDEFAIFECGCNLHYVRRPSQGRLVGTNHYCTCEDPDGPLEDKPLSTLGRYVRLEKLLGKLYGRPSNHDLPAELIQILGDDEVERRDETFATAYSNVACPWTGEIWYTFGGYPAASRGNWQRLAWPWEG